MIALKRSKAELNARVFYFGIFIKSGAVAVGQDGRGGTSTPRNVKCIIHGAHISAVSRKNMNHA